MENVNSWYFTKEQLATTPSRKCGIDANKELSYRQQAANFIQDMGQRLQVSQLCINTAIVYMHRFYVFHSFTEIHRNNLSVAALFLAAKVEEQPRKLEHVIKIAHACLHKDAPPLDVRSEAYADKQFEVVTNESILLQTLGFVLGIEHPHTYVVKLCQMVKACKDLAQTSYFMATTSLHMTTMCLQYKPTVVAAVCIHLACKWSSWKIEPCSEGKEWYYYVDKTVSPEQLEALTQDFVAILENSPHRFKKKFIPHKQEGLSHPPKAVPDDSSKYHSDDKKHVVKKEVSSPGPSTLSLSFNFNSHAVDKQLKLSVPVKMENKEKHHVPTQPAHSPVLTPSKKAKVSSHSISIDVYREKKEKERLELKSVPSSPVHNSPPVAPPPPAPEPCVQHTTVKKSQHALNDSDRVHKHASSSAESHHRAPKEKSSKSSNNQEHHQVHSASMSKVNHHISKKPESLQCKDNKTNLSKISSNNDPVVVLERVDYKSETHETSGRENSQVPSSKLINALDYNLLDTIIDMKDSATVCVPHTASPATITKSKHHKHKSNSVRSNHNAVHPHQHKRSPDKDIKTNGSKETDISEKRNCVENSVSSVKTPESSSKHEKREKHRSKHSSSSSKDKIVSVESSNPAIKVKIRKEVISKLPEKSPKVHSSTREESPKKSLKIKLPKPPAPVHTRASTPEPVKTTVPLKLVITKDKSGSGAYCTSRKNDRESRKRAHSPSSRHEVNYKRSGEIPSKHIKLDRAHSSLSNAKQNKSRHSSSRNADHVSNSVSSNKLTNLGNDSMDYYNVDVENYAGQPYYGNQYFPYQVPPLPPPPPPPPLSPPPPAPGYKGKTNLNHYLSTQPPPPSLPPPE